MTKEKLLELARRQAQETVFNWKYSFCAEDYSKAEDVFQAGFSAALDLLWPGVEALDKIRDPRKRHAEPDKYTELGCVMNIADEFLAKLERDVE